MLEDENKSQLRAASHSTEQVKEWVREMLKEQNQQQLEAERVALAKKAAQENAAAKKRAPLEWTCDIHRCHLSVGPKTCKNGELHNRGRQFYLCPRRTTADDCSMHGGFRWADGCSPGELNSEYHDGGSCVVM